MFEYLHTYIHSGRRLKYRLVGRDSNFIFPEHLIEKVFSKHTSRSIHENNFFFFFLARLLLNLNNFQCEILPLSRSFISYDSSFPFVMSILRSVWMPSLEKRLCRSSAQFFIGLFIFFVLSCVSCFCILEINPLWVPFVCKYFLPFWGLSFHLIYGFLCCAKALKLIRSHLLILFLFSFL